MPDVHVISSAVVEALRRKAKKLTKQSGIAHHAALDAVARAGGAFPDWHHLIEAAKATEPAERAFKTGLVIGMDRKDADGIPASKLADFLEDERVAAFVAREFEKRHPKPRDEDDEWDLNFLQWDLVYFRSKMIVPETLDDALQLARKVFFFPPEYLRLRGTLLIDPFEDESDV